MVVSSIISTGIDTSTLGSAAVIVVVADVVVVVVVVFKSVVGKGVVNRMSVKDEVVVGVIVVDVIVVVVVVVVVAVVVDVFVGFVVVVVVVVVVAVVVVVVVAVVVDVFLVIVVVVVAVVAGVVVVVDIVVVDVVAVVVVVVDVILVFLVVVVVVVGGVVKSISVKDGSSVNKLGRVTIEDLAVDNVCTVTEIPSSSSATSPLGVVLLTSAAVVWLLSTDMPTSSPPGDSVGLADVAEVVSFIVSGSINSSSTSAFRVVVFITGVSLAGVETPNSSSGCTVGRKVVEVFNDEESTVTTGKGKVIPGDPVTIACSVEASTGAVTSSSGSPDPETDDSVTSLEGTPSVETPSSGTGVLGSAEVFELSLFSGKTMPVVGLVGGVGAGVDVIPESVVLSCCVFSVELVGVVVDGLE